MQSTETADKRRLLSTLSHVAVFFSGIFISIGVPVAILFVSDDEVVKANAKESINFHLTALIVTFVVGCILFLPSLILGIFTFGVGSGFLPAVAFGIGQLWVTIMTVLAVFKALGNPNEPFRYPFIIHFL
jgi:uncharacterized Tic20 family protein